MTTELGFDAEQGAIGRREQHIEVGIGAAHPGRNVCFETKRHDRIRDAERGRQDIEITVTPIVEPVAGQRRR